MKNILTLQDIASISQGIYLYSGRIWKNPNRAHLLSKRVKNSKRNIKDKISVLLFTPSIIPLRMENPFILNFVWEKCFRRHDVYFLEYIFYILKNYTLVTLPLLAAYDYSSLKRNILYNHSLSWLIFYVLHHNKFCWYVIQFYHTLCN